MTKKILLVFIYLISLPAFSSNDVVTRDFVPLEIFGLTKKSRFPKDSISDRNHEYVGWRCLALATAMRSPNLEPNSDREKLNIEGFKEFKELAAEHAYFIFNDANKLTDEDYRNANPFYEKAKEVLRPLVEKYLDDFNESYIKNGEYFNTEFLKGDIDTCGSSIIMMDELKK